MNKRIIISIFLALLLSSQSGFAMKGNNPGRPGHSLDQMSATISTVIAGLRLFYSNVIVIFENNNPFYYNNNNNDCSIPAYDPTDPQSWVAHDGISYNPETGEPQLIWDDAVQEQGESDSISVANEISQNELQLTVDDTHRVEDIFELEFPDMEIEFEEMLNAAIKEEEKKDLVEILSVYQAQQSKAFFSHPCVLFHIWLKQTTDFRRRALILLAGSQQGIEGGQTYISHLPRDLIREILTRLAHAYGFAESKES